MTLSGNEKAEVIGKFAKHENDSGSAEVQVALITARLSYLQGHFNTHKNYHHSRRGLMMLVGQRRRLLDYIKSRDVQKYRDLISTLGIRK